MATKKPMKKFKRYDEGGSVEEAMAKQRGLDISNKEEPVGFFERLRAGNIDQPGTEAYNRFGAGRGRAAAVEEDRPMPVARPPAQPNPIFAAGLEQGKRQPSGDASVAEDYAGPRTKPIVTAPAKPTASKPTASKPTAPAMPVPSLSNAGPMRGMRSDASPPQYAGPLRGMRSDANTGLTVQSGRRPNEEAAADKIPTGSRTPAPQGEKIDSSEIGRNVGNALMATGVAGLGALGAYKAKRMYDAAKAAKKASSTKKIGMDTKKLSGPRKDSDVTDVDAKKRGGAVKKYASGGMVSSASKRADGIATKGKTRGKFV